MFRFLILLFCITSIARGMEIRESRNEITLRDEIHSASISKRSGKIISLKLKGRELITGGQGYWSLTGRSDEGRISSFPHPLRVEVTADPAKNNGKLAQVSVFCPSQAGHGSLPADTTFHYALVPKGGGLYVFGEIDHRPGLGAFGLAEARFVIKPDPEIFDYIHIDDRRSLTVPSGSDWDRGSPLNLKEARRMTTGVHQGRPEHKYGYSAVLSETPAYGWCSTREKIGLWMLNPSIEYIAGGPTKPELTAHLDVNPGGRPVLLNMWHGSHYGGTSLQVAKDESWSKMIGPFVIHLNDGDAPEGLAIEATRRAEEEAGKWPFKWVESPLYAADRRVRVSGHIAVPPEGSGPLWVGLTAPDYTIDTFRGTRKVDWQHDGKFYQYWGKADADGNFILPHVRPGRYTLHAFCGGILGEFTKTGVNLTEDAHLGELRWTPERAGRTLWEIGIPDRSAAEFAGGDHYWKWGNYYDYQNRFPEGVDFTIGSSDWKKDWFFCQPPRLGESGRVESDSTWKVRFHLDEDPPDGVLRIALCGFREGGRLLLRVNGQYAGDTGRFPENGVMHRDGIRGTLRTWSFPISADKLRKGENVIEFRSSATVWHQGILYDYVRLERIDRDLTSAPMLR